MSFFARIPTLVRHLNPLPARLIAVRSTNRSFVTVDISKGLDEQPAQHRKRKQRTKQRRDSGRAAYRFVDRTRVHVSGGTGGKGSLSLHHMGRKHKKRPDGGHGGNGGSVVIVADPNEQSLRWTHPHIMAESGKHGSSQNMIGRKGKNTVLRVPCGVVVRRVLNYDEVWDEEAKMVEKIYTEQTDIPEDSVSENYPIKGPLPNQPYLASNDYDSDEDSDDDDDEEYEGATLYSDYLSEEEAASGDSSSLNFVAWGEREKVVVAELDEPGSFVVVARGGQGGKGSGAFATYHGPVPHELLSEHATPQEGESAYLELELKMISDLGFVGFPNAGKSSLLSAMSRASPHIAPYPFTTLNPLVGYIEYRDGFRVCAADIPGLIAGASEGRGRGHDFLRHLERTKALLYIVDAAGVDGRDPVDDFRILVDELAAYGDGSMLQREALVVANKVDLISPAKYEVVRNRLDDIVRDVGIHMHGEIMGISAGVTGEGLSTLSKAIRDVVQKSQSQSS
jgi:GTP-binding protein